MGRSLSGILLADHLGIAVSRSRRIAGRRRRAILLQDASSHARVVGDGLAADEGGRTLRKRGAGGRTQRRGCESVEGRHGEAGICGMRVRSQDAPIVASSLMVSMGLRSDVGCTRV